MLSGELVDDKMNMAIYGNTATFSGDEVFSNGLNTKLTVPLVSQMNLKGYDLGIVGWFEDYNTGDIKYHEGLNRLNISADQCDDSTVKRDRTANNESTCIDLTFGKASWVRKDGKETGILHDVLKNHHLNHEEVFYYVVPGTNYYYYASVTVVRATSIYYESNGVTYCSCVLPYSIAAYCQKPPASVQDLATAAAIYGCTAKQYFGA